MRRTEGKNGSFTAIRMRIHQNFSSSITPSWTWKEKKTGAGGYAQISDCCVTYLLCYSIAGHSLGALMYLILFSWFKKFECLGDVLASVSLPEFAKLRSQLLDVFIITSLSSDSVSDFDLAQHFSCSVKTVECGQLFILACGQLRKKAQHNFIGQF